MKRICRTPAKTSVLLVVVAGLVMTTGCNRKEPASGKKELMVLCGKSFRQPAEQFCKQFTAETGIEIVTTVAGSEDFLPLIKAGKMGDILITHDPYLDETRKAGALGDSVQVGFVAPVLAVQKGNPKNLAGINDLARTGLKVGLTDPDYSTCGEMVFALLEKKGIKDAVLKNVENRLTREHSALGTWLKTQVVDAVIMWNGVAHTFKDDLDVVQTPYEYDTEVRVHIIGLSYTNEPDALKQFISFAREKGPAVFAEHGYVK